MLGVRGWLPWGGVAVGVGVGGCGWGGGAGGGGGGGGVEGGVGCASVGLG